MVGSRKHGAVPVLVLVPAVAGMYLAAGCAVPDSPTATGSYSTTTVFTTTTSPPATMRAAVTPTTTLAPTTTAAPTTEVDDAEYAAVCANAVTGERLADTECDYAVETYSGDDSSAAGYAAAGLAAGVAGAAMWYYLSTRNRVVAPAVGGLVSAGTYTTPTAYVAGRTPVIYRAGSIASSGGPVSKSTILRGGLGSRSHSGS